MKKLMILNGSLLQVPLIRAAKEEGYYTIVCDRTATNPGIQLADKHYQISVLDFDSVMKVALKEHIDGIISNYENSMSIVAKISELLHLQGNPELAVKRIESKYKFREVLQAANLFSPEAFESEDVEEFCEKVQKLTFPVIVKPSNSSASRGITVFENYGEQQIRDCFDSCQKLSLDHKVTAENYVEARDAAFFEGEIFVFDGKVYDFGMFTCLRSKKFPLYPQCDVYPPLLSREESVTIKEQLYAICREAGYKYGIINVEGFIEKNGEPFFIEINARQGGGDNPLLIQDCCNVDMYKLLVTTAMNDSYYYEQVIEQLTGNYDTGPYINVFAVFSCREGLYRGLHIDDDVKEYIYDIEELHTVNTHIDRAKHSGDRVAKVRLRFPNREQQLRYTDILENKIYAEAE